MTHDAKSHEDEPALASPLRRHLLAMAIIMTLLAVYGSFVPMTFKTLAWEQAVSQFRHVPYLDLGVYKRADFVANIVLFVPLGFFWLGALDLNRRSRVGAILAAPLLLAILIALAIAVEFAQQWTIRRTVSQNDMIAESVGSLIGIVLWFTIGHWLMQRVRLVLSPGKPVATQQEQNIALIQRWRRFLLLYAIGFVLYNIQPLDIALSPASIKQKLADGRVLLMPFKSWGGSLFKFNSLWQAGSDILLFIPIGLLLRLGRHHLRSLVSACLLALLVAVAIETTQLFIFSRYVDTTDLITSTIGGIIGAYIAGQLFHQLQLPDHERIATRAVRIPIALGLCLGYTFALLAFSLQPFDFDASHAQFIEHLHNAIALPFTGHYVGTEFNAMTKVMRDVMYFAPYGVLLRWAFSSGPSSPWLGRLMVTMIALVIGCTIEVAQAATLTRYADSTSVMLNIMGGWLGWWTWGLIGRKPRIRGQRSEVSGQRSEVRGQKSEAN